MTHPLALGIAVGLMLGAAIGPAGAAVATCWYEWYWLPRISGVED